MITGQNRGKKPAGDAQPNGKRMVVGPGLMMNQLLAAQLEAFTGEPWGTADQLFHVPPVLESSADQGCRRLVLWDGQGKTGEQLSAAIQGCASLEISRDRLALFNLSRGTGVEQVCLWRGVSGFFYAEDDLEQLKQGVQAMLDGKVWITPEMLAERVASPPAEDAGMPPPWNMLISRREQEVLGLLVKGNTNQEISEQLSISPHTVKTHVYKLFKKINVSNRLEAVIWHTSLMSMMG